MDFYRLNDKTNIYDLDIIESFENAISIIEWPEKLIEFIPEKRLNIKLSIVDDDDDPVSYTHLTLPTNREV